MGATLDLDPIVSGALGATSFEEIEFEDGSFAVGTGEMAGGMGAAGTEAEELRLMPLVLDAGGASEEAVATKVMSVVVEGARSELACDWSELRLCSNVVVTGKVKAVRGAVRAFCAVSGGSFNFCARSRGASTG
jgi:hypothetical protein